MSYAFIDQRCVDVPVEAACPAMRVSKSAFSAWYGEILDSSRISWMGASAGGSKT
jgi:hypothetical protein